MAPNNHTGTILEASHLKKSFGKKKVLADINFSLSKGENLAVLGRSGSGKSVLLKCIAGLVQPDGGDLNVFDKKVNNLSEKELDDLRKYIGFLFQGGALYDFMNVQDNLAFALKRRSNSLSHDEIIQLAEEALENVGLLEASGKLPEEISGGMKKRVALARALILKPQIMLYDEPTTGLDPITAKEISLLILEMQKKYNMASVIVTHDIACARLTANNIVVLRNGRFIAQGTYEELTQNEDEEVRAFFNP